MRPYLLWLLASLLVGQYPLLLFSPGNRGAFLFLGLAAAGALYAELEAKT